MCVEEADNGPNLAELWLPADAELRVEMDPVLKVPAIVGQGVRRVSSSDALYTTERPVDKPYYQSDSLLYVGQSWAWGDAGLDKRFD